MDPHHLPSNLTLRLNHHLISRQSHQPPAILMPEPRISRPNLNILSLLQPQRIILINPQLLLRKIRRGNVLHRVRALERDRLRRRSFRSLERRPKARNPSVDSRIDLSGEEMRRQRAGKLEQPVEGPDRYIPSST